MSCCIFGEWLLTAFVAKYCDAIRWPQWTRQRERIMVSSRGKLAPSMGNGEILASVSIIRAVVFESGHDARGSVANCFVGHNGNVDAGQLVDGPALVKTLFRFEARAPEWTVFRGRFDALPADFEWRVEPNGHTAMSGD